SWGNSGPTLLPPSSSVSSPSASTFFVGVRCVLREGRLYHGGRRGARSVGGPFGHRPSHPPRPAGAAGARGGGGPPAGRALAIPAVKECVRRGLHKRHNPGSPGVLPCSGTCWHRRSAAGATGLEPATTGSTVRIGPCPPVSTVVRRRSQRLA